MTTDSTGAQERTTHGLIRVDDAINDLDLSSESIAALHDAQDQVVDLAIASDLEWLAEILATAADAEECGNMRADAGKLRARARRIR